MKLIAKYAGVGCIALAMAVPCTAWAQNDDRPNTFSVSTSIMARGEYRDGGLPEVEGVKQDEAKFILERTRLSLDYSRKWLELRVTAQHSGVWGEKGKGSFNLYETWAKLRADNGLFAQVGRQELSYDDERILGRNDWAMAANSHDALKMGYEGHGHKAHVVLAYNQKAESTYGGTVYTTVSGAYPHKSLIAAWYHYDLPRFPLGASLLFMNVGMQGSGMTDETITDPPTNYQQLLGAYVNFHPQRWNVEGSYYRQMGKDEFSIPIQAWMAALKVDYTPDDKWKVTGGYDYLSGDDNPVVPVYGTMGMALHKKVQGFNTIYGSHHKFYGAMDFFYVSAFYGGYTPGLQNLYIGASYNPIKRLNLTANYHYLATASKVSEASRTLGHEIELSASYSVMKEVKLSAGYSYMKGSKTLERLQRVESGSHLQWAWAMLTINPRIFTTKW